MAYPNSPGYTENVTSKAAAKMVEGSAKCIRARVLRTLELSPCPLPAEEIAIILNLTIYQVRPRLTELFRQGSIEKVDTVDGTMGSPVWTWQIKP